MFLDQYINGVSHIVITTLIIYVVIPNVNTSLMLINPVKAIIENNIESINCEIIVEMFTRTHKKLLFFLSQLKTYVSRILHMTKHDKLAKHMRGVVESMVCNADDAKSTSLGMNNSDICVSITNVINDKKPIHTDLRACRAPYFSLRISVANDIEQYSELPNVTARPKMSTHFITSILAITAIIATHINKPTLPNNL